jgi:uncharacterized membrane protein
MKVSQYWQGWTTALRFILITASLLLLFVWLAETPPGLLGKADAVGYAICHRIEDRSFSIDGRQFPLCARCTGMYLGALLGMVYLKARGKIGGTPSLKVMLVLGGFFAAFAIDGVNSYLQLFPTGPGVYEPQNWLRLATGTGVGLGMAAMLVPVFNQTVWQQFDPQPALKQWRQLGLLVAMAVLLNLAVLTENPFVLYPLALLGALSVMMILTLVYTVVWTMIARRENRFTSYRSLWVLLLAGFTTALAQIAIIDAGRYWLTGTWSGFDF